MSTTKEYQEQLDELNTIFFLILERYKESYPIHKSTSSDNERLYKESKSRLDTIFNDLFVLESQITAKQNNQDNLIKDKDKGLNSLKKQFNDDVNRLNQVKNNNLASYPFKDDFKYRRTISYVGLAYYIITLLFIIYLFNNARHVLKISATPTHYVRPLASIKVALFTTFVASLGSGWLAAHYG